MLRYVRFCHCFLLTVALLSVTGIQCNTAPSSSNASVPAPAQAGPSSAYSVIPGAGVNNWAGVFPVGTSGTGVLYNDINAHRASLGLSTLAWHDGLAAIAHVHADLQSGEGFPDMTPQGLTDFQRLVSSNPPISFANATVVLHWGVVTDLAGNDLAIQSLLQNAATKSIIENPNYTQIGIGWSNLANNTSQVLIFGQNVMP